MFFVVVVVFFFVFFFYLSEIKLAQTNTNKKPGARRNYSSPLTGSASYTRMTSPAAVLVNLCSNDPERNLSLNMTGASTATTNPVELQRAS